MYEHKTYESILQSMLNEVPSNIDKRQGSIIYDALAPAAIELTEAYLNLENVLQLTFADTASGSYLTRRCAEFGVNRLAATKAKRKVVFEGATPAIGDRYSLNELTYIVADISAGQDNVIVECEISGEIGNRDVGKLIPITELPDLVSANLTDIVIPGENEESDDALYQRYLRIINEPTYGGNVNQYRDWVLKIDGVGDAKIFPLWNGAGTVKAVIVDTLMGVPSAELIQKVQNELDPDKNGNGYGLVPIGHVFTAEPVTAAQINIETTLELAEGYSEADVKPEVENEIKKYFKSISFSKTTVRVSYVNSAILGIKGINDITSLLLNSNTSNLTISETEVPVLGTVTINVS